MKLSGLIVLGVMLLTVLLPLANAITYLYLGNKSGAANIVGGSSGAGTAYYACLDVTTTNLGASAVQVSGYIFDYTVGSHYIAAIWDSTGAILAYSSSEYTTTGGSTYKWITLPVVYNLLPSTTYKIGLVGDNVWGLWGTNGGAVVSHADESGNTYFPPNNFVATANYGRQFLLYVDYTTYLGPFYSSGAISFGSVFNTTGLTYGTGRANFADFNMAGGGAFSVLGIKSDTSVTTTIQEAVAGDHILAQTVTNPSGNFTIYLPGNYVKDVSGAVAWHWNNSTKLVNIQVSAGISQVNIKFNAGDAPLVFYVSAWFIDQAGNYFHVPGLFNSIYNAMITLASSFTSALSNAISILYQIYRLITGVIAPVIFWFTGIVNFFFAFFTQAGNLIDAVRAQSTGINEIFGLLSNPEIITIICAVGFLAWINSIQDRSRQRGSGQITLIMGDIQTAEWVLGTLYNWSMAIFNFIWGLVSWFIGLIVNVVT